eukprot:TRINITY_DN82631_c0_g1_i1.p1 TRINITY_DN82631_c0_g1~~TRINITY_DN82631_c0_g1_i1.p1  ORF type:complete len:235 (-),score=57.27 TRINITY_DN82631_c0_g1_i1:63-767(-)
MARRLLKLCVGSIFVGGTNAAVGDAVAASSLAQKNGALLEQAIGQLQKALDDKKHVEVEARDAARNHLKAAEQESAAARAAMEAASARLEAALRKEASARERAARGGWNGVCEDNDGDCRHAEEGASLAEIKAMAPDLTRCTAASKETPSATLAGLEACKGELDKVATNTLQAQTRSKDANQAYVGQYNEIMTLLQQLAQVHTMTSAFNEDQEKVRSYLVGQVEKAKKEIHKLA